MSLNQLFDRFFGSQQNGATDSAENQSNGLSGITDKIPGGLVGGLAAGGLLGALVGNKKMRKSVGKFAGGAVVVGGTAALGAVAFKAYKNWQGKGSQSIATSNNDPQSSIPSASTPTLENFNAENNLATDGRPLQLALIKAMIAAANADNHIDNVEQAAIFDAVNRMELAPEDKAMVFDTLQNPPTPYMVAALAANLEQASEIYLASRLAIDPDHSTEQAYLHLLALQLSLPDGLVQSIEDQINSPEAQVA